MTAQDLRVARVLEALTAYVARTGDQSIHGGEVAQTAQDWANYSQIKPSHMPRWWAAGAFEPEAAQSLIERGIGAGLAKRPCEEGCEEFETFAYQVSMGKMPVDEAVSQILA